MTEVLPGTTYVKFKEHVSTLVNISPQDVALGGSSKFGFSLNPDDRQKKLFREFNDHSDLDLILVSPKLFEDTWNALKKAFYNEYYWVMKKHSKHIFGGVVFLDESSDYNTKYLVGTQKLMKKMSSTLVFKLGVTRAVKYRIYSSWDDVYAYHTYGIQEIKKKLNYVS